MATNNSLDNSSAPFTVRSGDLTASGTYSKTVGATAQALLVDSTGLIGGLAGAANTIFVGGTKPSFTATPQCTDLTLTGTLKLPAASTTNIPVLYDDKRFVYLAGGGDAGITNGLFIGVTSGNSTWANITGKRMVYVGPNAAQNITSGTCNAMLGANVGLACNTGSFNTFLGTYSGFKVTSGSRNCLVGEMTAGQLTTGSYNTILGYSLGNSDTSVDGYQGAGYNYTSSESSNIVIMNDGTTGESNKIRIGTQGSGSGQQNAAYIAGIYNTAVGATAGVVLSDSSHQLGGLAGSAGQVLQGGTKPAFSTATYPSTTAIGDVLISTAANTITAVSGAATSGYVLTANGAGTSPTFQANPGTGIANLAGDTGTATGTTVTIAGGTGITTSATGTTVTITATGSGSGWMTKTNATGDVSPAVSNTAYTINHATPASLLTITLPSTYAVGDRIEVVGNTSGKWSVVAAAGDTIKIGNATTSSGGSISATNQYDAIEIVCVVADTTWVACKVVGNITYA